MGQVAERPYVQEMVIVHRVFRREYALAPEMVARVADGDVARAEVVGRHLAELGSMLHHHHTGEDELVWPRLLERAELSEELVQRMQDEHERVAELLHRLDELLPVWRASARAQDRDDLVTVLREVSVELGRHLDEEEREVLPLVEQHLSVQEWAELGERGMASISKARLLVLLGHILEETTPDERRRFLSLAPLPARVAFRLVGQRSYAREVAELRQGLQLPRQRGAGQG